MIHFHQNSCLGVLFFTKYLNFQTQIEVFTKLIKSDQTDFVDIHKNRPDQFSTINESMVPTEVYMFFQFIASLS
jgi:hypothetical protein